MGFSQYLKEIEDHHFNTHLLSLLFSNRYYTPVTAVLLEFGEHHLENLRIQLQVLDSAEFRKLAVGLY